MPFDEQQREADAHLFALPAAELVAAAGYVITERSRERRVDDPRYELDDGRLNGFVDLYHRDGVAHFSWLVFQHLERPLGRRGFTHADASVWIMLDDYRGPNDEVEYAIDRDCRATLIAQADGRILGGEQRGVFTMLVPDADGYGRASGRRDDEPIRGPLEAFDAGGLVDIRTLAGVPFPPPEPKRGLRRLLSPRRSRASPER